MRGALGRWNSLTMMEGWGLVSSRMFTGGVETGRGKDEGA